MKKHFNSSKISQNKSMVLIPSVVERTRHGEKIYDIYSRLLKDRIIFLAGPIIDPIANSIIAQMLYLAAQEPNKEIKFYINSPGGVLTSALAIYDTIQYVNCPVSTVCVGAAASGAAVLLAAGTKGKRFALPNSEILLHQVAVSGLGGQAVEVEIAAKQVVKLKNKINNILARHTGQPLDKVEKDTDRDFYLSADEAKKYGIIDEVIKTKEQI
jgi:ATP-dependent Clp protease protease subunit